MSPLRLLRVAALSLAGLVVTGALTVLLGGSGPMPPGLLLALLLWVIFPIGYHTQRRHALACDLWASILLAAGALTLFFASMPKQIGC